MLQASCSGVSCFNTATVQRALVRSITCSAQLVSRRLFSGDFLRAQRRPLARPCRRPGRTWRAGRSRRRQPVAQRRLARRRPWTELLLAQPRPEAVFSSPVDWSILVLSDCTAWASSAACGSFCSRFQFWPATSFTASSVDCRIGSALSRASTAAPARMWLAERRRVTGSRGLVPPGIWGRLFVPSPGRVGLGRGSYRGVDGRDRLRRS